MSAEWPRTMQIGQEYGRKVSGYPQHRSGYQEDGG
jgi:hypothetical protein